MLPTMHNGLLDSQHQDGCGAHQLQPGEEEEEGGVGPSTCAAVPVSSLFPSLRLSLPLPVPVSLCLRMESSTQQAQ